MAVVTAINLDVAEYQTKILTQGLTIFESPLNIFAVGAEDEKL